MIRQNKSKFAAVFFLLIAIVMTVISYYLINRFSYSKEQPYYPIASQDSLSLKVGIIGDSWVAGGILDSLLHKDLNEMGIRNNVLSSGQVGAKSKLVYKNMFKDSTNINSSKNVLVEHPEYCVIIAGVNDSQGQVGATFYSYHMAIVIQTLLYYNIKPVILELPKFDIVKATENMGFLKKMRNVLFSKFNNHGEINNIAAYRESLHNELQKREISEKILFINFDSLYCFDDKKNEIFSRDGIHLNREGRKLLCHVISNLIKQDLLQQ